MRYVVDGDPEWWVSSAEPDTGYWLLDAMSRGDAHRLAGEGLSDAVVVRWRENGYFDLEFPATGSTPPLNLRRADILVAHQAIVGSAGDRLNQFGSADLAHVDYRTTGLSIATSLLDDGKRKKRFGIRSELPPAIRWGDHEVSSGDFWELPGGTGPATVLVEVENLVHIAGHGIAISATGGQLVYGAESQSEVIVWPSEGDRSFEIGCPRRPDTLRVTTVYAVGSGTASRVDRWGANAGMWTADIPDARRVYRCNYYLTSPPTFDDLVFSIGVRIPTSGSGVADDHR